MKTSLFLPRLTVCFARNYVNVLLTFISDRQPLREIMLEMIIFYMKFCFRFQETICVLCVSLVEFQGIKLVCWVLQTYSCNSTFNKTVRIYYLLLIYYEFIMNLLKP